MADDFDDRPREEPEPEAEQDPAGGSPIAQACSAALDLVEEQLAEHGGRVVAGFVCVVAEGMTPNGGMWFAASEDGPQEPDDRVAFVLTAVQRFAQEQGVPMAVMDAPEGFQGAGQG